MRILANVFHPAYEKSRIIRLWAEALENGGCLVRVHQGGGLDASAEQRACEEADRILFVHPFHWYGCPWPMKEWLDTVLEFGWAYGGPDRLAGKEWLSVVSIGAGEEEYRDGGSRLHPVEELLRPFALTARFCRMTHLNPVLVYGTGMMSGEEAASTAPVILQKCLND